MLIPQSESKKPISNELIRKIDSGSFIEFDANEVSDKEQSVVYGTKFTLNENSNEPLNLYLTAYTSTSRLNTFTCKIIACFCLLFIVTLIPSVFILRRILKKQVDAVQEFLRISDKYSKGDFSEKIEITNSENLRDMSNYVNALAANVQNNDETSKTFIANVSHELRTPMTTISGFVDGILDGTIPKSRQQEYLTLVSKEIKRLRILISSMLNMSRLESGSLKPNYKESNLTDLVIQTVLMFEKKIEDKNIEIEGLDSDRIDAEIDADLIQQVIYNLVENAVKFTDKGGKITFSFEDGKENCCIIIRNTGEGLKDEQMQQVFDRFYKADSSRGKNVTGLGLGLSISRSIVRIHNGKIAVRSVYGEYTEFVIKLPKKHS